MTPVRLKSLGLAEYALTYADMQAFNEARDESTVDEIWTLEHPPVFTLGLAGRRQHLLDSGDIPVIQVDRGGQVTYHGPGQLVVYVLMDLRRNGISIRDYVQRLEQAIIDMLGELGLAAARRPGAPGVYVDDRKIAALGVRVRRGCCYHGLAVNVDMDLAPFEGINPCGYEDLEVTQVADYGISLTTAEAAARLLPLLTRQLGLTPVETPATVRPPAGHAVGLGA